MDPENTHIVHPFPEFELVEHPAGANRNLVSIVIYHCKNDYQIPMPYFLFLFWKDHPAELQIQGAKAALHLLREAVDFFPSGNPMTVRRKASEPAAHLKTAHPSGMQREKMSRLPKVLNWMERITFG